MACCIIVLQPSKTRSWKLPCSSGRRCRPLSVLLGFPAAYSCLFSLAPTSLLRIVSNSIRKRYIYPFVSIRISSPRLLFFSPLVTVCGLPSSPYLSCRISLDLLHRFPPSPSSSLFFSRSYNLKNSGPNSVTPHGTLSIHTVYSALVSTLSSLLSSTTVCTILNYLHLSPFTEIFHIKITYLRHQICRISLVHLLANKNWKK